MGFRETCVAGASGSLFEAINPLCPVPFSLCFLNIQWLSEAELASEVYFLLREKRGLW